MSVCSFYEILDRGLTEPARQWLMDTRARLKQSASEATLLRAYTAATRQLGKEVVEGWRCDDLGRLVLLLDAQATAGDADYDLIVACYESGDSSEQISWLRALPFLARCERFAGIAIDSCRTNILPLFQAIACENRYPARYFPELNFNQMVLKSLFNGTALSRIVDLETRVNPDLSRMANDYVSEREAAGRPVPPDIWYVVAPFVSGDGLSRVQRYLESEDSEHRRWAAAGLKLRRKA